MYILKSIILAFSMFSRIPTPQLKWDPRSMRWAMAAFPLVGIAVGGAVFAWGRFAAWAGVNPVLYGAGFALLPVLVTGGIHLDGFCDTADALSSRGERQKRLDILQDTHIGAFAAISVACYMLLYAAVASQIPAERGTLLCLAASFVAVRALSGLSVVALRPARGSGLAHSFSGAAAKRSSAAVLALTLAAAAFCMVCFGGAAGLFMLAAAAASFGIYCAVALRTFGGVTGDLAGWFLQVCELSMLCALVLAHLLRLKGLLE